MTLDINTPRGQNTLPHEQMAYQIFQAHHEAYTIKHTDKAKAEPYDGWIMHAGKPVALVETKCRADVNYYEFRQDYKNRWLITEAKLNVAACCARRERLPLYGFLYFVHGQVLLKIKLANSAGVLLEHDTKRTRTQATVNGGEAWRVNGFVDMSACVPMQLV